MRTPDPIISAQLDEIVGWLKEPVLLDPDWLTRMMACNASSRREVEGFFFLFEEKRPLTYNVHDGVAVLPIRGPLAKQSAYRTTYGEIIGQLAKARDDRKVRAILLDVDSPGGVVSGMYEAATAVRHAREAKPVWALANDYMTSAAYGVASGASKILSTRYGTTGSIGVVLMHLDYSKQNEKLGVKPTFIFGGRKKTWGNPEEPLSEEAREDLQKVVDHHYADFTQLVANSRGQHLSRITSQEAGVFLPEQAKKEGLVDDIQSFDEAQTALCAEARRTPMSQPTEPTEPTAEIVSLDAAREAARAEGRREAAERSQQIAMLCQLNRRPELAGEFINGDKTPAQVGQALLELSVKDDEKLRISGAHGSGLDSRPTKTLTQAMVETLKGRGMTPRPDTLSAYVPTSAE